MTPPQPSPLSLEDVIVEPAPDTVQPDATDALLALSHTLAHQPQLAVQRLVETAMRLTGAGSAGVTLEDEGDRETLRWIATTGECARLLNGTMPRDNSPCGIVLQRGRALVMRDPGRHFEGVGQIGIPVREILLAPFERKGRLVGTVWVITHRDGKRFTVGDLRLVEKLTTFATAIMDVAGKPRRTGRVRPAP